MGPVPCVRPSCRINVLGRAITRTDWSHHSALFNSLDCTTAITHHYGRAYMVMMVHIHARRKWKTNNVIRLYSQVDLLHAVNIHPLNRPFNDSWSHPSIESARPIIEGNACLAGTMSPIRLQIKFQKASSWSPLLLLSSFSQCLHKLAVSELSGVECAIDSNCSQVKRDRLGPCRLARAQCLIST